MGATAAARYWGIGQQEYYQKADVWPLNPQGEIFCCLQIERADCTQCAVTVSREGRIAIRSDAVEMGTAIGTALTNRVAAVLGVISDSVSLAAVDAFSPLELITSGDPYSMAQADQDEAAKDPRWVPAISAPSSASIGAHVSTHGANEAAHVIFRFGLWPAALDLWKVPRTDPLVRQWERARWQDGSLIIPGRPPLTLAALAERAHTIGAVTGAMVHGFNRWEWSRAFFLLAGEPWTADSDALAVRMGAEDGFRRIERSSVHFPSTANERIGTDLFLRLRHPRTD